jgi:hypothetical protein
LVAKSGLQFSALLTKTVEFKGVLGCVLGIGSVLFGMQFRHPIHNCHKPLNRHHELPFAGYQITVSGGGPGACTAYHYPTPRLKFFHKELSATEPPWSLMVFPPKRDDED